MCSIKRSNAAMMDEQISEMLILYANNKPR